MRPRLNRGPADADAGALLVTRRRDREHMANCHNGCRVESTGYKQFRDASHYAWLLGHKTPLCSACAKAWPKMWGDALDPSHREAAVKAEVPA